MPGYHIQRSDYTPRNAQGLEGKIRLGLTVVSEYLHVGGGEVTYNLQKQIPQDVLESYVEKAIAGNVPDLSSYFSPRVHAMAKYGDRLVIPGSTIKGLVRSRLELSIPGACYVVDKRSSNVSQRYVKIFHPLPKPKDKFDPAKFRSVCPVCDLLGNTGLASRVSFSDFVEERATVDYVNFRGDEYEVAKKGSTFSGEVVYRGLKDYEVGMLLYGFGFRLSNGSITSKVVLMGRFKFEDRRFGRVKFSLVSQDQAYAKYLQAFLNKFRPQDFNEEW